MCRRLVGNSLGWGLRVLTALAASSLLFGGLRAQSAAYFPHIGIGGAGDTSIETLLQAVNYHSVESSGTFEFYGDDGLAMAVAVNGGPEAPTFAFSVGPGEAYEYILTGSGAPRGGWLAIFFEAPAAAAFNAVFKLRQGGVESEAGVLSAPRLSSANLVYDSDGETLDMGIALANPDNVERTATLVLSRADDGQEVGLVQVEIPAHGHLARMVSELFAPDAANSSGLAHLNVRIDEPDIRLPMVALRVNNGRLTTIPTTSPGTSETSLPQIGVGSADGAEIQTVVYLVSRHSDRTVAGRALFRASSGEPMEVLVDCEMSGDGFDFELPPRQVRRHVLCGDQGLRSGWLSLEDIREGDGSAADGGDLVVNAIFQVYHSGNLVSEAGVLAAPTTRQATTFVSVRPNLMDTGIAVANRTTRMNGLTAELYGSGGELIAQRPMPLEAGAHFALFVSQLFPEVFVAGDEGFTGILSLWSSSDFSATALQQNGLRLNAIPAIRSGVFTPTITHFRILETRRSPASVSFELDVVDHDRDLVSPTGSLRLSFVLLASNRLTFGSTSISSQAFIDQETIQISTRLSFGGSVSSGSALFSVSLSDRKGNSDGVGGIIDF